MNIGDKVSCIDDTPRGGPRTDELIPRKGEVYSVRGIVRLKKLRGHDDGLFVHEIVNAPRTYDTPIGLRTAELSFAVSRFRPATSIEVFLRILEKAGLPAEALTEI